MTDNEARIEAIIRLQEEKIRVLEAALQREKEARRRELACNCGDIRFEW
jgi:hypothetical protein